MSAAAEFMRAMQGAGLEPERIVADGNVHRCRAKGDKAGFRSGWYVLHVDGMSAGAFGDWRTGNSTPWRESREKPATAEENRMAIHAIAQAKADRDRERAETRATAQRVAARRWRNARPANPEHPYLVRKAVKAYGLRQEHGLLVLPLRDERGVLWSIQTISPDGIKRFQRGARKRGLYHSIGGAIERVICIAEGYATAATLHEATGYPVACAFDSGNLLPVAQALRAKYPEARLVLCADDDSETEKKIGKNPGIEAATRAARAVDGVVATPTFNATTTVAGMPDNHAQRDSGNG